MWPGLEGRSFRCGLATSPFRLALCASSRSSPAPRISSIVAPGCECERASRAASSFTRNCLDTVAWSRESSAVSGSTRSRSRWEVGAFTHRAGALASTGSSGEPPADDTGVRFADGAAQSSRVAATERAAGIRTAVTTSRRGGSSTGFSSATSSFASCLERPKNRGSTSPSFSGVSTFESSYTVDRQRRPSRRGSMTAGREPNGSLDAISARARFAGDHRARRLLTQRSAAVRPGTSTTS
jgi:hypothetical protein